MNRKKDIICLSYLALAVIASAVLTFVPPTYSADPNLQRLLSEVVLRGILVSAILVLFFGYGYHKRYPLNKETWRMAYWTIPCFLSVLANFPFSALIQGTAAIDYPNYIWLFGVYCLSIGVLEELLFRVIILDFLLSFFKKSKHQIFWSVFWNAAIFGLYHLSNLISGAAILPTLLQVGYSFLVGGMFAITFLKTKNLLYPIILHTIFDFGGFLVPMLGHGNFQDMVFWILTGVFGALVLVHCLYTLYTMDKQSEVEKKIPEA